MKNNFFDFSFDEFKQIIVENGFKEFNAKQVFDWVYKKFIFDFNKMTNIPKKLSEWLNNNFEIYLLKEKIKLIAKDGTTKFLFELEDGNKIETVLMNFDYGNSICVTTQVGCNMGCKFCASGQLKKVRNLKASEIIMQLYYVNYYLFSIKKELIKNIVVMGIGEPLDNYDNLSKFLNQARNQFAFGIGSRKITVSTCGLVNKFDDWINDFPQVGLAISLHAPNDEIRSKLMPINNAYNINDIINNVNKYIKKTNRRITFEYILIDGVNDTIDCANQLAKLVKGILCYVNLIPYNAVDNTNFKRSKNVKQFYDILKKHNITVTVRQEKGSDIDGSCGQLRARNERN